MGSAAPSAVGVDDPGLGGEALRDLMSVVSRRQAGADVEELPDAIVFRQAAHRSLPPGGAPRRPGTAGRTGRPAASTA